MADRDIHVGDPDDLIDYAERLDRSPAPGELGAQSALLASYGSTLAQTAAQNFAESTFFRTVVAAQAGQLRTFMNEVNGGFDGAARVTRTVFANLQAAEQASQRALRLVEEALTSNTDNTHPYDSHGYDPREASPTTAADYYGLQKGSQPIPTAAPGRTNWRANDQPGEPTKLVFQTMQLDSVAALTNMADQFAASQRKLDEARTELAAATKLLASWKDSSATVFRQRIDEMLASINAWTAMASKLKSAAERVADLLNQTQHWTAQYEAWRRYTESFRNDRSETNPFALSYDYDETGALYTYAIDQSAIDEHLRQIDSYAVYSAQNMGNFYTGSDPGLMVTQLAPRYPGFRGAPKGADGAGPKGAPSVPTVGGDGGLGGGGGGAPDVRRGGAPAVPKVNPGDEFKKRQQQIEAEAKRRQKELEAEAKRRQKEIEENQRKAQAEIDKARQQAQSEIDQRNAQSQAEQQDAQRALDQQRQQLEQQTQQLQAGLDESRQSLLDTMNRLGAPDVSGLGAIPPLTLPSLGVGGGGGGVAVGLPAGLPAAGAVDLMGRTGLPAATTNVAAPALAGRTGAVPGAGIPFLPPMGGVPGGAGGAGGALSGRRPRPVLPGEEEKPTPKPRIVDPEGDGSTERTRRGYGDHRGSVSGPPKSREVEGGQALGRTS